MNSASTSGIVTFLFTDIEGSTRLWEQEPERMSPALARHDALARAAVEENHGVVVKMIGDGMYAAFDDPLNGIAAIVQLQRALADSGATHDVSLRARSGLHAGIVERRDNDFFGSAVNRAARIMGAAHGGQILVSQAVADRVRDRLSAGLALHDLGTVRLRDLASPEHVYQLVHPQLRREFPTLRSLEATPNNLPQQLTSFIGREQEFVEIKELLRTARLLTLLGMGGLGKTRLSLQVAADVLDDYPDGVWFVELAPLADERLVPQAVASVLGVKEEAGRPVQEALVKYVKDRQLLLILDNCEHLVHACAELVRLLLQAGPQVRILASSREHLHLMGERTYAVPPLAVPDPNRTIAVEALTRFEAVCLFIDRAVAARPAFQMNSQNAGAVADICHRLDGIPLALELAAARVRTLSVEKIAERLGDRFRLLTSGDKTVLPRQQTLRALIDWSYDLLDEHERALLRRLAVFAGGWTLEAAEAVGAGGDVVALDVLDLLTRLVEKSLVALDADGARYRLLETVREYAQGRLDEAGESGEARTRHLTFHLTLAEAADAKLHGPGQGAWFSRLDLERENLLLAHAWCDHAEGGAELGLKLIRAVTIYWLNRGLLRLGYRVTVEALARPGAQERSLVRCRALSGAGQLGYFLGSFEEAHRYLEEYLSIARELGDKGRIAGALALQGLVSFGQRDLATARVYYEESLALARELGNQGRLSHALNALAELNRAEGDLDGAEPLYLEALALHREQDDRDNIATTLLNLARVSVGRSSADQARALLLEALAIANETGSKWVGQALLNVSAGLAAFLGEWERAARFDAVSDAERTQMGIHGDPADEAFLVPLIARARDTLGAETFAAAAAAGRARGYENAVTEAHEWLQARTASVRPI